MKNSITFVVILLSLVILCMLFAEKAMAQQVEREGNNFTQVSNINQTNDILTIYTYTVKDVVYPIWITKNGRCYIVRTSKKGNQYKQYLSKEISLQICKELDIEYKE